MRIQLDRIGRQPGDPQKQFHRFASAALHRALQSSELPKHVAHGDTWAALSTSDGAPCPRAAAHAQRLLPPRGQGTAAAAATAVRQRTWHLVEWQMHRGLPRQRQQQRAQP